MFDMLDARTIDLLEYTMDERNKKEQGTFETSRRSRARSRVESQYFDLQGTIRHLAAQLFRQK